MARRRSGFALGVCALALPLVSCLSPEELRREDRRQPCRGWPG
jgi:hypothetical protein